MTEHHIPTEQELDMLLECRPAFDPDAVKRNVLAYAAGELVRPRRRKLPVRGLLIAAVACVLSVSAITAADYATGGRISRSLGIQKQPQQANGQNQPGSRKAHMKNVYKQCIRRQHLLHLLFPTAVDHMANLIDLLARQLFSFGKGSNKGRE